jgi:lycopene cyclase domain-containing protein
MYHSGFLLNGLPIEECLFFIVIPYASIFLHEAFILYFPSIKLNDKFTGLLSYGIIIISVLVIILNYDKAYTVYAYSLLIGSLFISIFIRKALINQFYLSFLLILVPFFIVNGILTGTFIESEVVWYNNNENLGIRILTIPVEDFAYGFSMIFFNLLLIGKLKTIMSKKLNQ